MENKNFEKFVQNFQRPSRDLTIFGKQLWKTSQNFTKMAITLSQLL